MATGPLKKYWTKFSIILHHQAHRAGNRIRTIFKLHIAKAHSGELKAKTTEGQGGFAIADDIKQNVEKILFHGKKKLTDINKLADEYLRLAYHGLIAKGKSFNAAMKTDFDETIGSINIILLDMGG
jgi:hypothetical protein